MYSSGTTGLVKGVALTHRNLIANVTSIHATVPPSQKPAVLFYTIPYFHVFGFSYLLKSIALCETSVIMERFQLDRMLAAVEEFGITHIATAPPVVVAMAKRAEGGRELRSLMAIMCGGAPIGRDVISEFNKRFPNVMLQQVDSALNLLIAILLAIIQKIVVSHKIEPFGIICVLSQGIWAHGMQRRGF